MLRNINLEILLLACFTLAFVACNSSEESSGIIEDDKNNFASSDYSNELLDKMIYTIPSPVEMSAMIIASGADYASEILNQAKSTDSYITAFQKALALGVYGTDLGYMNMYNKNVATLDYLKCIKELANDLKVGQFFDFNTLKTLSQQGGNVDSLLNLSTKGFTRMDRYLRAKKRGSISCLIATGIWVEGVYLATEIAKNSQNKQLMERIGEQKITLDNLLHILSVYKNQPSFEPLIESLSSLKKVLAKVKITTTYHEPLRREIDGRLEIIDQSVSTTNMDAELLAEITNEINSIRSNIIK